jgi:hypothetical protein
MPACGNCTNPCNCNFSEDGALSFSSLNLGRNFTSISGSGTEDDPYEISFLDQEEYRPKTAEINITGFTLSDSTGSGNFNSVLNEADISDASLTYESPIKFIVRDTTTFKFRYIQSNFFIIGASLSFPETTETTSAMKHLMITTTRTYFPTNTREVIAAHSTPGAGGDPVTLSCAGIVSGVFSLVPVLETVIQEFFVYAYQDTGAPITITGGKIWVTAI